MNSTRSCGAAGTFKAAAAATSSNKQAKVYIVAIIKCICAGSNMKIKKVSATKNPANKKLGFKSLV